MLKLNSFFLLIFLFFTSIHADEVTLRNGKKIENVKIKISKDNVSVQYSDTKIETYSKNIIKTIRLKPIIINNPVTEKDKLANEKEKIRVSESLQELTGFEIPADKKLKIAVLNFKANKNLPKEEADIIINTMTTNLVKTKLFIIIDPLLVTKTMNEQGGDGCSENPASCKISPNEIAKNLDATKVITGSISKIQNKYFINSNVIDVNSNNVDFAETENISSFDKITEGTETFSKKVAGGIASVSNTSVSLNEESEKGFLSKLFSSTNEKENKDKSLTKFSYTWRSAIIPGWGQFTDGRKLKSFAIFGFFFGAIAFEKSYISKQNSDKDSYSEIALPYLINTSFSNSNQASVGLTYNYFNSLSKREEINNRSETISIGAGLIAAIYLYNVFDAYFFSNSKKSVSNDRDKIFHFDLKASPTRYSYGQTETQYSISVYGNF